MGPVYDDENIVFYHKDFSNWTFWNENLVTGNWNKKVKASLTESAYFKSFQYDISYREYCDKEMNICNMEMQRKTELSRVIWMLLEGLKQIELFIFTVIIVNWAEHIYLPIFTFRI